MCARLWPLVQPWAVAKALRLADDGERAGAEVGIEGGGVSPGEATSRGSSGEGLPPTPALPALLPAALAFTYTPSPSRRHTPAQPTNPTPRSLPREAQARGGAGERENADKAADDRPRASADAVAWNLWLNYLSELLRTHAAAQRDEALVLEWLTLALHVGCPVASPQPRPPLAAHAPPNKVKPPSPSGVRIAAD